MNNIVLSVSLGLIVANAFADGSTDYRAWILANGGAPVCAGGTSGTAYHASYPPQHAFDGDVSADSTKRYLGEIKRGACLIFGADMGDRSFTMSAYRICQLRAGDYANARAPTSWTLSGGDTVEGPWTEIETQSEVSWSGLVGQKSPVPALDDCWRFFRLSSAQTYKFYKIAFTASRGTTAIDWNVGVMEVEFLSFNDVHTTFVPPHAESTVLTNENAYVTTTYDESAYPVDAGHALSFEGFDAVESASTIFLGGWWDFGSAATDNFFSQTATCSGRTTIFDGSIVKNVGRAWVAGTSGMDNTLVLTNGTAMNMTRLAFGAAVSMSQHSKMIITDGSSLECSEISMCDASARSSNIYRQTGNELYVTGAGSCLTVSGQTLFGREEADGYGCGAGGNLLSVTDGAVAELGALKIANLGGHGVSNRVVFAGGAKVNMSSFTIGGAWWGSADRMGGHDVRILDGAVVTNRGRLTIGANYAHDKGDSFLISNAVFHTEAYAGGEHPVLIGAPDSTFTISGSNAAFTYGNPWQNTFSGPRSSFVVENGAKFAFPYSDFSYSLSTANETLLVRSGAEVTRAGDLATGNACYKTYDSGLTNSIVVESDAKLVITAGMALCGRACKCEVNDGAVTVGNDFSAGKIDEGTNSIVNICGSHPYLKVSGNMYVRNDSVLRFVLPEEGYDEGWATEDQPLVCVGSASAGKKFLIDDSCRIEFAGAEEMLARHRELSRRGKYVLLYSDGDPMSCPDEVIAAVQATLPGEPGEMTLKKVSNGANNKHFLMLTVKPKFGLLLLVR